MAAAARLRARRGRRRRGRRRAAPRGAPPGRPWRRRWRGGRRSAGPSGGMNPLALLTLPDRHPRLDLVDDLARAREGRVAMRRARGHDDARLAELDASDAVIRRRLAEPVALDR